MKQLSLLVMTLLGLSSNVLAAEKVTNGTVVAVCGDYKVHRISKITETNTVGGAEGIELHNTREVLVVERPDGENGELTERDYMAGGSDGYKTAYVASIWPGGVPSRDGVRFVQLKKNGQFKIEDWRGSQVVATADCSAQ